MWPLGLPEPETEVSWDLEVPSVCDPSIPSDSNNLFRCLSTQAYPGRVFHLGSTRPSRRVWSNVDTRGPSYLTFYSPLPDNRPSGLRFSYSPSRSELRPPDTTPLPSLPYPISSLHVSVSTSTDHRIALPSPRFYSPYVPHRPSELSFVNWRTTTFPWVIGRGSWRVLHLNGTSRDEGVRQLRPTEPNGTNFLSCNTLRTPWGSLRWRRCRGPHDIRCRSSIESPGGTEPHCLVKTYVSGGGARDYQRPEDWFISHGSNKVSLCRVSHQRRCDRAGPRHFPVPRGSERYSGR